MGFHKVKLGNHFKLESRDEESEVLSFIIPVVSVNCLEDFIRIAQNMNTSTGRIIVGALPI